MSSQKSPFYYFLVFVKNFLVYVGNVLVGATFCHKNFKKRCYLSTTREFFLKAAHFFKLQSVSILPVKGQKHTMIIEVW